MSFFEALRDGNINLALTVLTVHSIFILIINVLLARAKNLNVNCAILFSIIPVINYFVLAYYVGMPKIEKC